MLHTLLNMYTIIMTTHGTIFKEICLHAQEKILFYGILNILFQMQADRHGINNLIHSEKKNKNKKKPLWTCVS